MKKEKGITLIALVITIIVMLILTGATIAIVTEGGLIDKAQSAKTNTQAAADQETNDINTAGDRIAEAVGEEVGIVQPDSLYIPTEGEILTKIYINPDPLNPVELSSLIYEYDPSHSSSDMYFEFEDGERNIDFTVPIECYAEGSNDYDPDYPQYVLVLDTELVQMQETSTERSFSVELYVKAWEEFTYSIWDMPETTYQIGWNKVNFNFREIYNEVTDEWDIVEQTIGTTIIQPNELPVFRGSFTVNEEALQYGKYTQYGYLMHPTWNYGIYPN